MKAKWSVSILVIILIVGAIVAIQSGLFLPGGESTQLGPLNTSDRAVRGQPAPGFTLLDYDDNQHSLSDYQGKFVVLNFWASWCPFCIDEMPDFQAVYEDLKDQDVVILGINRGESKEVAERYSNDLGVSYPLFMNRADDVAKVYQIRAMPSTFFIDKEGVIQDIKLGPMTEEEMKARIFEIFTIGEKIDMPKDLIEGQDAENVPAEVSQSGRTISVTKGEKHSIPLEDIKGGGPPKDGIPSIDKPKFESVDAANKYLTDDGIGIAVSLNGIDRFYPNQITVWHEIVNDNIGGTGVLITYCPLCGTGIVFDPIVNGKETEFGTSGKLWNSNLLMYDRQTDSYWSQILGEAVKGEMTGTKLNLLPHQNLSYGDWKKDHPNGEVMSRNTGHVRDYTRSPYGDYDTNNQVFFPVDNSDGRYHVKEPTWQIEVNRVIKIYPQSELVRGPSNFVDTVGGEKINVNYDKDTIVIKFVNATTGQEVVPFFGFWFSVIAVHPDAEVYVGSK